MENQSDVAAFADYKAGSETVQQTPAQSAPQQQSVSQQQQQPQQQAAASSGASGERVFISPLAKRIANENNVPVDALRGQGSGPEGRVLRSDVERVAAQRASRPQEQVSQAAAPAQTTTSAAQATAAAPKTSKPAAVQAGANPFEDLPVTNVRSVNKELKKKILKHLLIKIIKSICLNFSFFF